jgi:hypothetical protein
MSIFKEIGSAATNVEIISSADYSANSNINVSSIKVTNHHTADSQVKVTLVSGSTSFVIFQVIIPKNTTLVYDDAFSYPQADSLKITTTTGNLTLMIN